MLELLDEHIPSEIVIMTRSESFATGLKREIEKVSDEMNKHYDCNLNTYGICTCVEGQHELFMIRWLADRIPPIWAVLSVPLLRIYAKVKRFKKKGYPIVCYSIVHKNEDS